MKLFTCLQEKYQREKLSHSEILSPPAYICVLLLQCSISAHLHLITYLSKEFMHNKCLFWHKVLSHSLSRASQLDYLLAVGYHQCNHFLQRKHQIVFTYRIIGLVGSITRYVLLISNITLNIWAITTVTASHFFATTSTTFVTAHAK